MDSHNKLGKSAHIAAEAVMEGVVGTAAAFGTAFTDVILPTTMEAVEETKKLFPDPNNPGTDSEPYVKSLGIAAKTGIVGTVGVVAAGVSAVADAIIPAAAKATEEIKAVYSEKEEE